MPKFREVSGQFVGYVPDGPDTDIVPDREPMDGQVVFTPVFTGGVIAFPELVPPEFAHPEPIRAKIIDGFVRVEVAVGDDVSLQPLSLMVTVDDEASQVWSWRAEFTNMRIGNGEVEVQIPSWSFRVPDGTGPVDLTELVPLKSGGTVDVTKGPRGAGLENITAVDGQLVFEYTDGQESTVPIPEAVQGPEGPQGPAGADGEQGPQGPQGPAGEIPDLLVGNITDATPTGKNLMLAATEGAARSALGLQAGATAASGSLEELNAGTSNISRVWAARNLATFINEHAGTPGEKGDPGEPGPPGPPGSVELTGVTPTINVGSDYVTIGGKSVVLPTDSTMPVVSESDYSFAWADKFGNVAAAIDSTGAFRAFRGTGAASSQQNTVECIGDSLTRGYSSGAQWALAEAYPALIKTAYPHATITNRGISGRTVDEIRLHTGSLTLNVRPTTGQIPASGSVTVETNQVIGWGPTTTTTLAGVLAGVAGTLVRTPTEITFTRAAAGSAVPMPAPSPFVTSINDLSSNSIVLWAGRNDVNYDVRGHHSTVAEHVVSSILEVVDWVGSRSKSIIVVGTTNKVDEVEGTTGHTAVVEINERLASLLPHKYLNIRDYLVKQAIYDAGITPTQADLDNIANDAPPPSIWDNGSHYLKPIAPLVAGKIGERLAMKGYI